MRSGWIYPFNSMLQPLFDRHMLQLFEDGVYMRLKEAEMPQKSICNSNNLITVDFEFVILIFTILVLGIFTAIATYLLEKYGFGFYLQNITWP